MTGKKLAYLLPLVFHQTGGTQVTQPWAYEGPENWPATTKCGAVPSDILYDIQPEFFHITHKTRLSEKTGLVREFAYACPEIEMIEKCDPDFKIADEFCFMLRCDQYKFEHETFVQWVSVPEKLPKKLCKMSASASQQKVGQNKSKNGRSFHGVEVNDSDPRMWAYQLYRENDHEGCGPIDPDHEAFKNVDLRNYFLEYYPRKNGRLQANIRPINVDDCQLKGTTLGTTGKAFCSAKTKKWRVTRNFYNVCQFESRAGTTDFQQPSTGYNPFS